MLIISYPDKFKNAVKDAYPDHIELHAALEINDNSIGQLLANGCNSKKLPHGYSHEEYEAISTKISLYREWVSLFMKALRVEEARKAEEAEKVAEAK